MRGAAQATLTFGPPSALGRLRQLAADNGNLPLLQRLLTLSRSETDARFVGAIASFVASAEVLSILQAWAPENRHAKELDSFGRLLWSQQSLIDELRPFSPAKVAGRELSNFRTRRYLPVLLAARRPLPSNELSGWIQRLRVFLLIRAIDALESGFALEANLLIVCRFLLPICDQTNHPGRQFLEPLLSLHESLSDFAAEALLTCQQPEVRKTGRRVIRALTNVLLGERWSWPANVADREVENHALTEYARPQPTDLFVEWPPAMPGEPPLAPVDLGGGIGAVVDADSEVSPGLRRVHGEHLRLRHVEHSLFLRHTWHHLRADEERAVFGRIGELLHEDGPLEDRVGAAITLAAVLTSHSMTEVESLRVEAQAHGGWTLSVKAGRLERGPPRMARRWKADEAALGGGWVRGLASRWSVQFDERAMAPLRIAQRRAPNAAQVVDLWQAVSPGRALPAWYGETFAASGVLRRLTGPSTAFVTSVRAFEQGQDHVFARLVASSPRSALPGACAYSAYSAREALPALRPEHVPPLWTVVQPEATRDINASGSELDLIATKIRPLLRDLPRRMDTAAKSSRQWVEHHNLLCAHTVIALLACTGSRPVTSPFESLAWFDLERRLVYVEDKASGPTRGSRLCVLSEIAVELLRSHYLPHLERLAAALRPFSTEFADAVTAQLARDPDAGIPLFFFVRDEPTFSWIEVTETQLGTIAGFDWPLPWNLFRHFLATGSRRLGLHPDIRDALLGHADGGAESHGYHSFRVPLDDLVTARAIVDRLQDELGLRAPATVASASSVADVRIGKGVAEARLFGRDARRARRDQALENARGLARRQIEQHLSGREISTLTEIELEGIARRMLFRDDNVPHAMGSARYEVFEQVVLHEWQRKGQRAKFKRRFVLLKEGQPLFNDLVIDADRLLEAAALELDRLVATLDQGTCGRTLTAAVAAIDLILASRVAHPALVRALVMGEEGFRRYRLGGSLWLDWALGTGTSEGRPVFRVGISARALDWLSRCDLPARERSKTPPMPAALGPLANLLGVRGDDLFAPLGRLIELQRQNNALQLPGVLAGYLSGERASSALPMADTVRVVRHGTLPREEEPTADEESQDIEAAPARRAIKEAAASERCASLFAQVRSHLASTESRSSKSAAIRRRLRSSGFGGGDAPSLLVVFALHLLEGRMRKRGKGRKLAESTVLRYWDSLAGRFRELAHDQVLTQLDGDELTELYREIVELDASDSPDDQPSQEGREPSDGTLNGSQRALDRLKEFHEFVSTAFGIEDPDWSELCLETTLLVGRPGIVLLREYLAALSLQLDDAPIEDCSSTGIERAFALVLCARYGLRLREAAGLFRRDLVDLEGGAPVVLVQSNSVRGLKSDRSRRHIPPIEQLSEMESAVIAEVLRRWEHREGKNPDTPLLDIEKKHFRALLSGIGEDLRKLLKQVTGRQDATTHFLRHGFAMRALAALYGRELGDEVVVDPVRTVYLRRLLLGSDGVDRRLLWAVARLLGHASPSVTLYSYVNCLYMWLPHPEPRSEGQPGVAMNLDDVAIDRQYLNVLEAPQSAQPIVPEAMMSRLLRFSRLLAIGQSEHTAARRSRVPDEIAELFYKRLVLATQRLADDSERNGVFKLLGGLRAERLAFLADELKLSQVQASDALEEGTGDWLGTVGRSRQVVLYDEASIDQFAHFVSTTHLREQDVWLIKPKRLHSSLCSHLLSKVPRLVHEPAELGPTFQLDAARITLNGRVVDVPDRVVAVPARSGGQLRDTFELIILWLAYLTAASGARRISTLPE